MADKAEVTDLATHITDENQQVHVTILSAKEVDGDLYDVKVEFSDGSKGEGEMLSNGGRKPEKDSSWKLQLEARTGVPTVVPVKDKDGEDTKETEVVMQDRKVVVGYSM